MKSKNHKIIKDKNNIEFKRDLNPFFYSNCIKKTVKNN